MRKGVTAAVAKLPCLKTSWGRRLSASICLVVTISFNKRMKRPGFRTMDSLNKKCSIFLLLILARPFVAFV